MKWPVPERYNAACDFVDRHMEEGRAHEVAILYRDEVVTYGDLYERVNRAGRLFRELGIEMEQRILLVLPDCPEFVYAFFGAIKIGAVPVPLNPRLRPDDYAYFVYDARPKAVLVGRELVEVFENIVAASRFKPLRLVVKGEAPQGWLSFTDLLHQVDGTLEPADTHKDDVAFWLYSSGSTGAPKGTIHLQHDMPFCVLHYAKPILNIQPGDRTYSVAKLHFAYGLGNAMYFPLGVGASTILVPEHPTPQVILETIQRDRPTLFFSVPTAYNAVLRWEERFRYDVSSLRLCVSAGEALPEKLYHEWKAWTGIEILDGIGSTEALHIFISNRPGQVRPGSSGTVVPGYEAEIRDESGRPVPTGEVGVLWIKGDSVAAGYWNKQEKTQRTFVGSWLCTGDMYVRDEEGYYWYVGRSDDMIKAGGIWVSPIEVENVLIEHPAVVECAVVAHDDGDGLVKPKAFVVLRPDIPSSESLVEELKRFVKERLASYKCPRWFVFVDELPKTSTGKIQRFRLRQTQEGRGA
ncbi:benzoate-CoA ligase family protein [Calditerricola satsumensis]|uniref:Acetyl-CoA synthetase n=1 Tax=Calditerricola satsumensis TaxID=373054 RepID=A0A8J3FBX6_9BACI|nr:benzoate-CoA ligase family protein [Calditerricola satsumensis]GGK03549.1 acetyl-CoA synthetase [Calditerricola satsumensis]